MAGESVAASPEQASGGPVVPQPLLATGVEGRWVSFFETFAPTADRQYSDEAAAFLTKSRVRTDVELSENTIADLEACSDWPEELRAKAILRKLLPRSW